MRCIDDRRVEGKELINEVRAIDTYYLTQPQTARQKPIANTPNSWNLMVTTLKAAKPA